MPSLRFPTTSRRKHMARQSRCLRFRQPCCPIVCTLSCLVVATEYREVIIEITRPAGVQGSAAGSWRTIGEPAQPGSRRQHRKGSVDRCRGRIRMWCTSCDPGHPRYRRTHARVDDHRAKPAGHQIRSWRQMAPVVRGQSAFSYAVAGLKFFPFIGGNKYIMTSTCSGA